MLTVSTNLPEFSAKLRLAAQLVGQRKASIHKAFGVFLLSKARQDFQAMSRGGTSSFGEKWAPIQHRSLVNRFRKLKSFQDKIAAVKKSRLAVHAGRAKLQAAINTHRTAVRGSDAYKKAAKQIQSARTKIKMHTKMISLVKQSASGRKTQVQRLRAHAKVRRSQTAIKRLETKVAVAKSRRGKMLATPAAHAKAVHVAVKKLQSAKASRAKYLDKMTASHQIGVSEGRLRDSSQPGYDGGDGKGGNIFKADEVGCTVGYGRTYSGYFDEKRKLLPGDDNIPQAWRAGLEAIARRQTLAALGEAFQGEKGIVTDIGRELDDGSEP